MVKDWPMPKTRKALRGFIGKVEAVRPRVVLKNNNKTKRATKGMQVAKPLLMGGKTITNRTKLIRRKLRNLSNDNQLLQINYYRRFIARFTAIADPLLEKMKKSDLRDDEEYEVTPKMEEAFKELKQRLISAPILAHPIFDDLDRNPFVVTVDWSAENNAVGGTLEQYQTINGKGGRRVIAYAAKRLSPAQRSYSATKGELAAVLILLDTWRWYLLHRPFILRTDHAAIVHLRNFRSPTGMVARWQQRLECFNFRIEHVKGTDNGAADALSRAEHLKYDPKENLDPFEENSEIQTLNSVGQKLRVNLLEGDAWTPRMLRETQEEDADLKVIRRFLTKGEKPDKDSFNLASVGLKTYMGLFESLFLDNHGIIRYKYPYNEQPGAAPTEKILLILPEDLAYDAIKMVHERGAHMAAESTAARALRYVWCHNLMELAKRVCRRCLPCQMAKKRPKDQRHTLYTPLQGYVFQRVTVDYVGPLCKAKGTSCRYILTVQDSFSRWLEAFAVKTATAKTTLEILNKEIFARFGMIESVHSDRGSHFTANAVKEACEILNVPWTHTPSYNAKSSRVESSHRTLGRMLTALTQGKQEMWQVYLPAALFAIRSNTNRMTGYAPFRLLFGREPSTDLEMVFAKPNHPEEFRDYDDYAIKLKDRIHQAFRWAQENLGGAVRRQRRAYCQKKKKYIVGQQVWLFTPRRKVGQSGKYKVWWTGPWRTSRLINDLTYELTPHPSWPRQGKEVVSIDRLMPYYSDEQEGDNVETGDAPGVDDDLSMEGDEHAEDVGLPYVEDSEDEEFGLEAALPVGGQQAGGGPGTPPPQAPPPAPPGTPPPVPPGAPPPAPPATPPLPLVPNQGGARQRDPGNQGLHNPPLPLGQLPEVPAQVQPAPKPLIHPERFVFSGNWREPAAGTTLRPSTPHPLFQPTTSSPGTPFSTPTGISPRPSLGANRKKHTLGTPRLFGDVGELDESREHEETPHEGPLEEQEGGEREVPSPLRRSPRLSDPKRGQGFKRREDEYRRQKDEEARIKKEERDKKEQDRRERQAKRERKALEQKEGQIHGLLPDTE